MAEVAPAPAAAAPAKAPKKKAAAKPKKAGPSVGELIVKAVSASKERSGVSLAALKKSLAAGGYDVEKNEAYFRAIYQNAVALCADLCRQFGLDPTQPGVVICHAESSKLGIASNHADVLHWWPKHGVTMDDFRAAVKAAMAEYLKQAGNAAPASWSQQARTWA